MSTTPLSTGVRVLLVEDDARSAAVLRELLSTSSSPHFSIDHVTTAAAACAAVADSRPDLVILDLGLPDARNLDALGGLQSAIHEVPVIVLTGSGDATLAAAALRRGAEDYLLKGSFDSESLLRSIRYAIERHQSVRDLAHMTKQLETMNRDLERLSLIDPLTELLNRRGLQQAVTREVHHAEAGLSGAAVIVLDLDDFKTINESHGSSCLESLVMLQPDMIKLDKRCVIGIEYGQGYFWGKPA
ncbi:MAG TPA: response regulator [Thermoanaerobaculia bacterium]|nr:response regulator [Thermoanaerobaculia bacterium]